MILQTASEGISFARKLENDSAGFYDALAHRYARDAETFQAFSGENRKYITQIERAYYGVITDAIEGAFAFNIDPDNYVFEVTMPDSASYEDILKKAISIEELIIQFYTDAAEQSKSLMADVPRTFGLVAKKRELRKNKLKELLEK